MVKEEAKVILLKTYFLCFLVVVAVVEEVKKALRKAKTLFTQ